MGAVTAPAEASDLLISTFYESRPFEGLDVELDGRLIGQTRGNGEAKSPLQQGEHVFRIRKGDAVLAERKFSVKPDESAEAVVTFTSFDQAPEISLEIYGVDAVGLGTPGTVSAVVRDPQGAPLPGAVLRLEPSGLQAISDEAGSVSLQAPRGLYTLKVEHQNYAPAQISDFRIVANVGVVANVSLQPKSVEAAGGKTDGIEEIVVLGSFKPRTSSIAIEKSSMAITDAVSIEDLLRSGDSDVSVALKRIVGVSVSGDRYAVVRGLDGRYIASTLNGTLMPSTDPFRRDVQLDLFPSGMLGGIEIQKSFAADLPGDTTGGVIKMKTRDLPTEAVNQISVSASYLTGVTGKDIFSYAGGQTDWLGIDDGTRALPGALDAATNGGLDFSICQVSGQQGCVSQARAAALAARLPNIYNPQSKGALPAFDISYALGDTRAIELGTVGAYGSVAYGSSTQSRQNAFIDDLFQKSRYTLDQINTDLNAYLVAGLKADAGWEFLSKTIILRKTEDTTTINEGLDVAEGLDFSRVILEWVERQLLAQQFEGKLKLFGDHELSAHLGVSQSSRQSPDRRSYKYLGDFLALSTVERSYSDLSENGLDASLDYKIPYLFSDEVYGDLKAGFLGSARRRDLELVRIGFRQGSNPVALNDDPESLLTAENFAQDAFRLEARSADTDTYKADQDAVAAYLATETHLGERYSLAAGVRYDSYKINLDFPNSPFIAPVELKSNKLLPAVSAIFRPVPDVQLRAAYSATVSRPNITELAPSRFYDENDFEYIGCPRCTASTIDNFDIRAEYYLDDKNSVSAALFYKDIKDPLEVSVADASGSSTNSLTFRNNEGAKLYGLELDSNVSISRWDNYGLSGGANVSLIRSEIELNDVGRRLEVDPKRDLQGQSPMLANAQLSLEHFPSSQQLTVLANYFDDRIDRIARNQPSILESGRISLNLNYEKRLQDRSKVRLGLKNLLDAKTQYTQGGKVIESYRRGVEFSMGYSYNF